MLKIKDSKDLVNSLLVSSMFHSLGHPNGRGCTRLSIPCRCLRWTFCLLHLKQTNSFFCCHLSQVATAQCFLLVLREGWHQIGLTEKNVCVCFCIRHAGYQYSRIHPEHQGEGWACKTKFWRGHIEHEPASLVCYMSEYDLRGTWQNIFVWQGGIRTNGGSRGKEGCSLSGKTWAYYIM